MADADYMLKLLLVGDSSVGKSSILLRFVENIFDQESACTIGVDFKNKYILVGGKRLKLTVWDTAGQERFRTLVSAYYRNAHGVILVYDVTNRDSFAHVAEWMKEVKAYSTYSDVVMLLIGNKSDLKAERVVSTADGEDFARAHGMLFMECSAKTRDGIHQAFEEVALKVLERPDLLSRALPPSRSTTTAASTLSDLNQSAEEEGGVCPC